MTSILEGYAEKALYREFSPGPARNGVIPFAMVWHFDKRFDLLFDPGKKTLRFPRLLPAVPPEMYGAFKSFVENLQSTELPEHRRIIPAKARLRCNIRGGVVSLTLTVKDKDFEYATRKLIHAVHEIFLGFLRDGPYFDYLVEHFDLDPDRY